MLEKGIKEEEKEERGVVVTDNQSKLTVSEYESIFTIAK